MGDVDRWSAIWDGSDSPGWQMSQLLSSLLQFETQFVPDSGSILFPLCGRQMDMKYLYDKGHSIVGIEGSEKAIRLFAREENVTFNETVVPEIQGSTEQYSYHFPEKFDFVVDNL